MTNFTDYLSIWAPESEPFITEEQKVFADETIRMEAYIRESYSRARILISDRYLSRLDALYPVLFKAIRQVVKGWYMDERIRNHYQLDEQLSALLMACDAPDYRIGFCRPDLLIDQQGRLKICEIGARFPLNGWMYSAQHARIYNRLAQTFDVDWKGVSDQGNLLSDLLSRFDLKQPVYLIHEQEAGTEIFQLGIKLEEAGSCLISVKPGELEARKEGLFVADQPVNQVVFELDREELKKLRTGVLEQLMKLERKFNDPRTIILVHDKRILSVLWDAELMRDYLTTAEYDLLHHYLIECFVLKDVAEAQAFLQRPGNFILKINSGGRGLEALVRSECSETEWENRVMNDYQRVVVQRFVDQKTHESPDGLIQLVGMFLCCDDRHYGAGDFRGSVERVVNVAEGRAKIYPSLQLIT